MWVVKEEGGLGITRPRRAPRWPCRVRARARHARCHSRHRACVHGRSRPLRGDGCGGVGVVVWCWVVVGGGRRQVVERVWLIDLNQRVTCRVT